MIHKINKRNIFFILILGHLIFLFSCSNEENGQPADELSQEEEASTEASEATREVDESKGDETSSQDEAMDEEMRGPLEDLMDRAPEEPKNLEEIVHYPTGPLAGRDYKEEMEEMKQVVKDSLPAIEEEVDEEYLNAWWRAYRYLFAEEYPNPDQIITEMNLDYFGSPGIEDPRYQFKEQVNVLVILDVSGSMGNSIEGRTMMDIAKDSISDFTSALPENTNIGLRVYGHEGQRTGKSKEQSCEISELVYDMQPINNGEFQSVIKSFEPTGWTPIALALEEVKNDFSEFPGEENTNLVYVVSDGAETCGGDPVTVAQGLSESNIQPIINVIGFNVDLEGQSHLREIAEAGQGVYTNAGNEAQLQEAFDQAEELMRKWEEWKNDANKDAGQQRSGQQQETFKFMSEWLNTNRNEDNNLTFVTDELLKDGYITAEVRQFIREKSDERYNLYVEIHDQKHDELMEEITNNYEKITSEIDEQYDENTGSSE
ncbi:VWA domain-containing protein [Oceanobacillus piezotolerans]|uniref:VWA domain-containing protein n=1 Tax=Oceanobacillus piezotolerans TaxID=2448030 RepID=A0A498DAB1_9BACI|nr:VWA domain-containing protein [Oceanobacillus piezotolerans]RLL46508.1 VWA domain-containing protein [Oceanobacillus piezotolerans]